MKIVFIINPKAGQGKNLQQLKQRINEQAEFTGIETEIYTTKCQGDAAVYAKKLCEERKADDEELRILACGGDGTVNEVLNGIIGHKNVAMGVVPIGTGNDFCRNFGENRDFADIGSQYRGEVTACDAIKFTGITDGKKQTRYCANMFNIGLDSNVVDLTSKIKRYPLISGHLAYYLSTLIIMIRKKGADLTIEIDGEVYQDGPLIMAAVANGSYCGGGVKSAPFASVQDGLMDVNIVFNSTRTKFLKMFGDYKKGTYVNLPGIEKIVMTKQCREAVIKPRNGSMRLCTDGEITDSEEIRFEIAPKAFKMLVPAEADDKE